MGLSIQTPSTRALRNVQSFIDYATPKVDIEDHQTLLDVAEGFVELNNNKAFLVEYFNGELARKGNRRLAQYLSPQSFVFGASTCGKLAVRCNIWIKPTGSREKIAAECRMFSYGLAHNHNFSFLTIGHRGSGYRSELYEVENPESIQGVVGERINMRPKGSVMLPEGTMMLYRSAVDVHTQLPPDELSISLNLLTAAKSNNRVPQYYVDTTTSRIIGFPEVNAASKRLTLLKLAGIVGNQNTLDLLDHVLEKSECFRTRIGAAQACIEMQASDANAVERVKSRLGLDPTHVDVDIGAGFGMNIEAARRIG